MANIYDNYPDTVECGGVIYNLTLAYDRVLMAIDALEDPVMLPEDKVALQAALLIKSPPKDTATQSAVLTAVFNLFPKGDKSGEKHIDFHQDAAMIRSAFFRIGVDLTKDKIHFFQFLELLADLPRDTALMRVVDIRSRPLPKPTKHNREEIAALQKAKARCAIKISEEERMRRFAESIKQSSIVKG